MFCSCSIYRANFRPNKLGNYICLLNNKMRAIKNVRLKDYNYASDGYYFVTICTDYRQPYLSGETRNVVAQFIEQLPQRINGVKIDYHTIMPTHLHLMLNLENCKTTIGEIVRQLKAITKKQIRFKIWQPNYYEHVIRNETVLLKIREYILNNPLVERIEFKQFYKS